MALARNLRDRGYNVVFGKLAEDPSVLDRVKNARAVVTNAGDHANASCTLIVRELGFEGQIFALADDPLYRSPMLQIGATDVFTPAHVLGAALASRASSRSFSAPWLCVASSSATLSTINCFGAQPASVSKSAMPAGNSRRRRRNGVASHRAEFISRR